MSGTEDRAVYASETAGQEACFPAGYAGLVLDGVGHFLAREAPGAVADALHAFLATNRQRTA